MPKTSIQIRVDPSDLKWVDKEVQRTGGSRGTVIRSLIRRAQCESSEHSDECNP